MVFFIHHFTVVIIICAALVTGTILTRRYKLSMFISLGISSIGLLIINFILQEQLGSEGMGEAEYGIGYRYIMAGIILALLIAVVRYRNKRKSV